MSELPPEPRVRPITPAPEDYERSPRALALLWPVAWVALAAALWFVVDGAGWRLYTGP